MEERLLIDTDVLIDFLRGQKDAVAYLEELTLPILMSAITLAELYSGVREGGERVALETFVTAFELIPVHDEIAVVGGLYRRDYRKTHGVGLADALIAATAEYADATLVTMNRKHFPMLEKVIVPYVKES